MSDLGTTRYMKNRLREAREYLGLSREEVAGFLDVHPDYVMIWEHGADWPNEATEQRLSALYRRPISYLRGEPQEPVEVSPELDAVLQRTALSPNDRAEVLDFVEFLQHRGAASGKDS